MLDRLLRILPSATIKGYEHPELVEVVFQKTVAFQPVQKWSELADAGTVLDFGGACGLHYKMAQSPTVRWAVVETPAMVRRAKELTTDKLKFFSSIRDAADWLGDIDAMHSNGALQYTDDPEATLKDLCSLGARAMHWKRMRLSDKTDRKVQKSRLIDNGPGKITGMKDKTVKYRETTIPEEIFISHHFDYRLDDRGSDWFRFVR